MLTKYITITKVREILDQRIEDAGGGVSGREIVAGEIGIHDNTLRMIMSGQVSIGQKIQDRFGLAMYVVWTQLSPLKGAQWYEILDKDLLFGTKESDDTDTGGQD